MEVDDVSGMVVDVAVKIHRDLRPRLLESVYEQAMARALQRRGLRLERQPVIGFVYEGVRYEHGFRADLVIESCVLVELKSLERFAPVHHKQVLTYLRLANLPVGLLLNVGVETMKEGIKRIVNDLPPSARSPLRVNRRFSP